MRRRTRPGFLIIGVLIVLCLTTTCKKSPLATPLLSESDQGDLVVIQSTPTRLPDRLLCGLTVPDDAGASPWRQYWRYWGGSSYVHVLFKDGDWLWVGTRQGLVRLDLRTMDCTLFEHTGVFEVSLESVRSLALDPSGCLWVNGAGGLVRNCTDAWGEKPDWRPVHLANPANMGLGFDTEGNLHTFYSWGRGVGEYLRYDGHEPPDQGKWSGEPVAYPYITSLDDCDDWFSLSLPSSSMWFQSAQECRAMLAWRQRLKTMDLPVGLAPLEGSYPVAADSQGGWSLARRTQPSAGSVGQYVLLRWTKGSSGSGDWLVMPWPFAVQRDDMLMIADEARAGVWIGVSDGLVFSDGQTTQKFLLDAAGLDQRGPHVRGVVMDRAGRLWAATREGLLLYDAETDDWQPTAVPYEALISPDDQGGLWAVSSHYVKDLATGGHISHLLPASGGFDEERWQHHSGAWPCALITSITADAGGGLWLTGPGCGLLGFDGQELASYRAGFDAVNTWLARSPDGELFAASPVGDQWIQRYNGATWETLPQTNPKDERSVTALAVDHQGGLWVGYVQHPYLRYFVPVQEGLRSERQAEFSDAVSDTVLSLVVGPQGDLWVGVARALLRYDGQDWQTIPIADVVMALAEDRQGRVWVAGLVGFYVYDPTGE